MPEPSAFLKIMVFAAIMNGSSNVIAQAITAYKTGSPLKFQTDTVAAFTICAVIIAPYALWWMEMLEDALPGDIPVGPSEKGKKAKTKKNYKNILLKVLIDQTLGSCIQTFLFLMTIGYLKGLGTAGALGIVQRELMNIIFDGLKLWPAVSILCFTVISPAMRVPVGMVFTFLWSIYLSLQTA